VLLRLWLYLDREQNDLVVSDRSAMYVRHMTVNLRTVQCLKPWLAQDHVKPRRGPDVL
jgi:hypothetical protein